MQCSSVSLNVSILLTFWAQALHSVKYERIRSLSRVVTQPIDRGKVTLLLLFVIRHEESESEGENIKKNLESL